MTNSPRQFGLRTLALRKGMRCAFFAVQLPFFRHILFGCGQPFAHNFQIVIAIAKFNHQLGQGNQMFHLEAQRATAPAAHFFQFRPLFFRHADIILERFFCHPRSVPDRISELMRKYDLQRDTLIYSFDPIVSQTSPEGSGRNEETCGNIFRAR